MSHYVQAINPDDNVITMFCSATCTQCSILQEIISEAEEEERFPFQKDIVYLQWKEGSDERDEFWEAMHALFPTAIRQFPFLFQGRTFLGNFKAAKDWVAHLPQMEK